ncbi:unnamed protein product [Symbiodinium microadriaticum]|nr:unnamed protein product [Symbiodinium microadriaticum]
MSAANDVWDARRVQRTAWPSGDTARPVQNASAVWSAALRPSAGCRVLGAETEIRFADSAPRNSASPLFRRAVGFKICLSGVQAQRPLLQKWQSFDVGQCC